MFRVLVPGERIGISDVVAEGHLTAAGRAAAGSYVGCIVAPAAPLARPGSARSLTRQPARTNPAPIRESQP